MTMPALNRREVVQLSLLLLAVPIQFWLVDQLQQPNAQSRTKIIREMFAQANTVATKWLDRRSWIQLCKSVALWVLHKGVDHSANGNPEESPAKEVFELREKQQASYFASSLEPRAQRNEQVKLRVGQVVQHTKSGYRGVIVGWDFKAQAPDYWLKEMYKNNNEWMQQPNYLIIVDTRDRPDPQFTYVPQENLKVLRHTRIIHPKLYDYFEHYDGAQYIPRPFLQATYPQD